MKLTWDGSGQRKYETGVDHGVLYPTGADAQPWNGLTTVTETPGGADNNKTYADNIVYGALRAAETFGGTIEAYTCPLEFLGCDGMVIRNGVVIGQQPRKSFGVYYRTIVGTDLDAEAGHKHHFVYGATTSPSERAFATVNDSPAMTAFSWAFECQPVSFTDDANLDLKPTAILTIDDTDPSIDPDLLSALLDIALGTDSDDARMPTPDEVLAAMAGSGLTDVDMALPANKPTEASHAVTLPAVTGVVWKLNGVTKSGVQPAMTSGQKQTYVATAAPGYNLVGEESFSFEY